MSELIEKSLGELSLNVSSGVTPLKSNEMFWTNPTIPWLKTEQLGEKYIYETNSFVSEAALKLTSLRLYPENTLSIAMYGEGKTRGNVSILKKSMTTNQACCNLELDEDQVDIEYVYYYLKTQYEQLRSLSSGVRKNLNANDIKHFKIRLPKEKYLQKVISKTLSCLDQKIALNNQINAELETMAKTLYDYWFVQFDFPDENGNPYKSSGGKMVYNDQLKREIPEGWEVRELSEIANIVMGQSPAGDSYNEIAKGTVFFQGSTDFGWRFPKIRQYTTKPSRMAKEDDILLSVRAPVGTLNIAEKSCCIGRGLAALNSKDGVNSYLFHVMQNFKSTFDFRNTVGTTFGSITKDDLFSLSLSYPKLEILISFDCIVSKYNKEIKIRSKQNQELTQLRDWLLPMLMNGQVRVE